MNIFVNEIPGLNENYYIDYLVDGFKKNGHKVFKGFDSDYYLMIDFLKQNEIDLIVYGGFSFINLLVHQHHASFYPSQAKLPYIVMFYDNPQRYLYHLEKCKQTDYIFICCDSHIAKEMRLRGYKNTYYLPCCYNPAIQKYSFDEKYNHELAFAGSVFNEEMLKRRRMNITSTQSKILNVLNENRTPGKFLNYIQELERFIDSTSLEFGQFCFVNLMEQKHYLRMEMMNALGNHKLHIYGVGNYIPDTDNVFHHGYLNQHTELHKLYSSAKINLSIELLPASVHQRVIECFGCQGFVLMEDKADNYNCFSKNLVEKVVWRSLSELTEKINYYLNNFIERENLVQEFHKENEAKHTNIIRTNQILKIFNKK